MMRLTAGLKIALIALALVGVAACSSKDKPDVAGSQANATPGSERDFITNVGDRIQFIVDQSTLTPEAQGVLRRQATWLRQYGQISMNEQIIKTMLPASAVWVRPSTTGRSRISSLPATSLARAASALASPPVCPAAADLVAW